MQSCHGHRCSLWVNLYITTIPYSRFLWWEKTFVFLWWPGIGNRHRNMPSTDDGPVRFFPAYSFHFTKAGWSSMDGCTSFDHHGCQNLMTQVVAIDLSSIGRVDEPVPMQAGDIQLLHSQTEGADSKESCRTWHDSVRYGLPHLLDPVLILFLFSDHQVTL